VEKIYLIIGVPLILFLSSCSPNLSNETQSQAVNEVRFDQNSIFTLTEYLNAVFAEDYETAYLKLYPEIRDIKNVDDYKKELKSLERNFGKLETFEINKDFQVIDNDQYRFEVILSTPSVYVLQRLDMVRYEGNWFIKRFATKGYKNR